MTENQIKKHAGGRPSKYDTINLIQLAKLAELGLTDAQMAYIFGINRDTLHEYKKKTEFSDTLNAGKKIADEKVESSLYERATGYVLPEEHVFCYKGKIVRTKTMKHYPPDPTSMIFWLKNRKWKEWCNNQEIDLENIRQVMHLYVPAPKKRDSSHD